MRCCGTPSQQITVQTGNGALTLLRCSHCAGQRWAHEGTLLEREQAFHRLAVAYREIPLQARAARERAAPVSTARHAARLAQRPDVPPGRLSLTDARPDTGRLMSMLDGWQVLGAAG